MAPPMPAPKAHVLLGETDEHPAQDLDLDDHRRGESLALVHGPRQCLPSRRVATWMVAQHRRVEQKRHLLVAERRCGIP